MKFHDFTEQFGLVFDGYIQQKVDQTIDKYGDGIIPALEYLTEYNQGGKAIRPYMVYLAYKLVGGQDDVYSLMQTALINELVHLFALIHDDIVDKGLVRRHRPTYHIQLRHVYDDTHTGDSQALLVGDLLHTRAVQELLQIENPHARSILGEMIEQVILGEMLDVHYSFIEGEMSADDIATKDDLKSGQYTFTAPMLFGAMLADASAEQLDSIRQLGKKLGTAFQMRDDMLDRLPDDDGKTKFSDIREGNQTLVWQFLLDQASDDDEDKLRNTRRADLTHDQRNWLQDVVSRYDLKLHIGSRINSLLQEAQHDLDTGPWSGNSSDDLKSLIEFLMIK